MARIKRVKKRVYSAVRTESLYKTNHASSLKD